MGPTVTATAGLVAGRGAVEGKAFGTGAVAGRSPVATSRAGPLTCKWREGRMGALSFMACPSRQPGKRRYKLPASAAYSRGRACPGRGHVVYIRMKFLTKGAPAVRPSTAWYAFARAPTLAAVHIQGTALLPLLPLAGTRFCAACAGEVCQGVADRHAHLPLKLLPPPRPPEAPPRRLRPCEPCPPGPSGRVP